jgi:trimeric autotransporter adhesin
VSNSCLVTLAINASCTVNVTFTPASAGAIGGSVSVITNDGLTHVVQLTGTGIGIPMAAIAPLSLTFASQAIGTSSAAQQVIVASTGTAPLSISSIVLSDMADFQMTSNCPTNLAPNTNCSLGITFAPTSVGSISATVVVTANDGAPHTIQLSATGTGFAIAPASGSSASATVAPGQPATYQLSLSQMGFSGSVMLTCAPVSTIPNSTCSVSPNPATLSGTGATPVTVSVITAPQSGMLFPIFMRRFFYPGALEFRMVGWHIFFLFALTLAVASFKFRRIPFALACSLIIGMLICGCASGSSGGTSGGSTGTPVGTYQLLVTASSGGMSSKTTLTLIVQ